MWLSVEWLLFMPLEQECIRILAMVLSQLAANPFYVREDSDIAKAGADEDGIIGSAETLKRTSILGPLATTAHYQAIMYMEHFGLTADDFSMVSMDYPQAYQAFVTGEGDLVANKTAIYQSA